MTWESEESIKVSTQQPREYQHAQPPRRLRETCRSLACASALAQETAPNAIEDWADMCKKLEKELKARCLNRPECASSPGRTTHRIYILLTLDTGDVRRARVQAKAKSKVNTA